MTQKSWRPEIDSLGITEKVISKYQRDVIKRPRHISQALVEAGADAMLETLKKGGTHFDKGMLINEPTIFGRKWVNQAGTLVYIPDKES